MIDRFADITRDRYFIHTDPVRAAATSTLGYDAAVWARLTGKMG